MSICVTRILTRPSSDINFNSYSENEYQDVAYKNYEENKDKGLIFYDITSTSDDDLCFTKQTVFPDLKSFATVIFQETNDEILLKNKYERLRYYRENNIICSVNVDWEYKL